MKKWILCFGALSWNVYPASTNFDTSDYNAISYFLTKPCDYEAVLKTDSNRNTNIDGFSHLSTGLELVVYP